MSYESYVLTKINSRRASWVRSAIQKLESKNDIERGGALCYLLADLMHFAVQEGIDFDDALRRGRRHFDVEKTGEE